MRKIFFIQVLMLSFGFTLTAQHTPDRPTRYSAENNAVIGKNLELYNNRPLYCNNTDAFILTGDRPLIRFARTPLIYGAFSAAFVRNDQVKWLDDFDNVTSFFTANKMKWIIADAAFNDIQVTLETVPVKGEVGMAIHAKMEGIKPGDQLIWVYGGAEYRKEGSLSWKLDISGDAEIGKWNFSPASCRGNIISMHKEYFTIYSQEQVEDNPGDTSFVFGKCSDSNNIIIADASLINNAGQIKASDQNQLPVVYGKINLDKSPPDYYWMFFPVKANNKISSATPASAWQNGEDHADLLARRVTVNTPDERLNALVSASVAASDAVWYDPVYVHGAMLWNVPFPGWRTMYGGSVYGWHDRVAKQAAYYTSFQVKDSDKKYPKADTAFMLTVQHKDSRFYGKGRIEKDQLFYNFQSQFFDQLIRDWRSTGDIALQNNIRPALELHLQWQQDCFDPDGDGVYESYINNWPTDSQWYNGGGTAEETSYAYNGHRAAMDMARIDGDTAAFNFHRRMAKKIRDGYFNSLWVSSKGHAGAYREQGGYQRLHEDPWLYSIFLPVDASLVDSLQAASSLYYTEWALQNDHYPEGGREVWTSNWVPGIFSVRELYAGDNYHLALAYFLTGLADDGWDIMKGTFLQTAYNEMVPGNTGSKNGGTDFNDCNSMFARVLIEGLFGYRPDFPDKKVKIAPQFPKEWNHAEIKTPDFSINYRTEKNTAVYNIEIFKKARMELYLPVRTEKVNSVLVNGKPVEYELLPGFGKSIVYIVLPGVDRADITINTANTLPQFNAIEMEAEVGEQIKIDIAGAKILSIIDEQKVLAKTAIDNQFIRGSINNNIGYHSIFAKVKIGQAFQWRVIHIKVNDKNADLFVKDQFVNTVPSGAAWSCVNMRPFFNADVRTIYKQQYISPRPNTVSVRIGTDGYSPWTFLYWKNSAPEIKLDSVEKLSSDSNRIITRQAVPFYWAGQDHNIAFTSLWDNWPSKLTVPVNQKGNAVWLMIAGSTNPMQCHIANAILLLEYEDHSTDTISLIPPYNYWNLSPITALPGAAGQLTRNDYTSPIDSFAVPRPWPETVQLGQNCRAVLLNKKLKPKLTLKSITLKALSQEVVVGLMGITIMN